MSNQEIHLASRANVPVIDVVCMVYRSCCRGEPPSPQFWIITYQVCSSMEIGEVGLAHVCFQHYYREEKQSRTAQNTLL